MLGNCVAKELVKRNAIIAITGLIYAVPTVAILVTELGKPDCSYFSIVMTIGLVSIPQDWKPVRDIAEVKMSVGFNKIEDLATNILLFLGKVFVVFTLSALISPFIFIKNIIKFVLNGIKIYEIKNNAEEENYENDK